MLSRTLLIGLATLASPLALAQNPDLAPNFGEAALQTGFMPDPQSVEIIAGGPLDASAVGQGCVGYVAEAPDFVLTYTAGSQYDLTIFAESPADTTMVIYAPDGSWHCNDDADGLNPAIGFADPQSGDYAIWVGAYHDGQYPPAILAATELLQVSGSSAVSGAMPEPEEPMEPVEEDTAADEEESETPEESDSDMQGGGSDEGEAPAPK